MMRRHINQFLALCCTLLIIGGVFALAPQVQAANTLPSGIQQATATPAPAATATSGRRERIEAPQLRPQVVFMLIGFNFLVAIGVVLLALVMRRRGRKQDTV